MAWTMDAATDPRETAAIVRRKTANKIADKGVVHLAYIDGLRGLCALYIVFHHLASAVGYVNGWFVPFIRWGGYCVAVFITISGFCLMLPVTRAANTLRGGAPRFYWKRIRRILPPYYIALLCSILLYPILTRGVVTYHELIHNPLRHSIVMHALLLHNWSELTKYNFNGPLWSVAVECQIYVLFPLMVLLWHRFGAVRSVVGIGLVSCTAAVLLGYHGNVHYLLLFALGMWGAECAGDPRKLRYTAALMVPCVAGLIVGTVRWPLLGDVCVGALSALLLAREATESRSLVRRFLSWQPLRSIGLFSYSIYLLHDVPLLMLGVYMGRIGLWPAGWRYLFFASTAVPLLLGACYVFYLLFERPFISKHAKTAPVQEKLGTPPVVA